MDMMEYEKETLLECCDVSLREYFEVIAYYLTSETCIAWTFW